MEYCSATKRNELLIRTPTWCIFREKSEWKICQSQRLPTFHLWNILRMTIENRGCKRATEEWGQEGNECVYKREALEATCRDADVLHLDRYLWISRFWYTTVLQDVSVGENLANGCTESFCVISYNRTRSYNYLQIKTQMQEIILPAFEMTLTSRKTRLTSKLSLALAFLYFTSFYLLLRKVVLPNLSSCVH